MRVGYARVSTPDQKMEAQLERLGDCERVFSEKDSGGKVAREQLARCLEYVREGDTLVATRLDRLARSVEHLCAIAATLEQKGVALEILDQAIDTSTATGRLTFHILGAIAEFERSIRLEAQRAGMAHARAKGTHMGRAPKLTVEEQEQLCQSYALGMRASALARRYRVDKRTVYRYLERAIPPLSVPPG